MDDRDLHQGQASEQDVKKTLLIRAWVVWQAQNPQPHLISDFHTGRVVPDGTLDFSLEETLAIIFSWEQAAK